MPRRGSDFDFAQACMESTDCQKLDINLVCNANTTVQQGGNCACRNDMRWNTE